MEKPTLTAKQLFDRALDIASPTEREAYLDRACADTPDLREKVKALLRAHEEAGSFLEKPAVPLSATGPYQPQDEAGGLSAPAEPETTDEQPGSSIEGRFPAAASTGEARPTRWTAPDVESPSAEEPGARIGPYRLVQLLGQGGMGAVYLAEQEQPVKRRVALKIIKAGMDSAQVVARFEAERQTLAMMDHLNIAKVHDAGETPPAHAGGSPRPYFVMELVQGVPITSYCDQNRLTLRERLDLFVPVCRAIQHAHQKGIIHRDIKPSNVLVTLYDGKPVPKVIDFGIAKAIEQPLVDPELATQLGTILGTLEYMSPEQADLNALTVDTRSDIYSLGVLLYELLTGTPPLERSRLRQMTIGQVLRLIKEEEPPRPSARLTASGGRLPTISAERKTEPAKLVKLLRSDLEWIVLKALEKDRTRRYETAAGFARDVERYLADEPVEACPPSTTYLLRKFARRHRTLLSVTGGFAAMLVLGIAGLIVGLIEVNRARVKAEKALQSEILAEKQERAALNTTDAAIQAMIRNRTRLGEVEKSILRDVLKDYERFVPETGDTQEARALAAETQARIANLQLLVDNFAAAEASYSRAIDQYDKLRGDFGNAVEYRVELAKNHFNLGVLRHAQQNRTEAEKEYRQAIRLHEELARDFNTEPGYRRDLADDLNNLGASLCERDEHARGEEAYRRAIELGEKLTRENANDPDYKISLAATYANLGNVVRDRGNATAALDWYGRALALTGPFLTMDPPSARAKSVARNAYWDRANALGQLGQHAHALTEWQRAIELTPDCDSLVTFQLAAKAEVLLKSRKPTAADYFDVAQVSALAASAAASKNETGLRKYYVDRAMAHLAEAKNAGFFKDPRQVARLNERTFNVLRQHAPNFQQFVSRVGQN
jgi:serine/threonine protein kinase/tetratricopeptide (TPR) repeat protein